MVLHDQPAFCDVDERDLKRLGETWVRRNVMFPSTFDSLVNAIDGGRLPLGAIRTAWKKQRSGALKGVEACVCVALRGSLMYKVRCSVYAKRPKACREAVKPGDEACLQVREMFEEAHL